MAEAVLPEAEPPLPVLLLPVLPPSELLLSGLASDAVPSALPPAVTEEAGNCPLVMVTAVSVAVDFVAGRTGLTGEGWTGFLGQTGFFWPTAGVPSVSGTSQPAVQAPSVSTIRRAITLAVLHHMAWLPLVWFPGAAILNCVNPPLSTPTSELVASTGFARQLGVCHPGAAETGWKEGDCPTIVWDDDRAAPVSGPGLWPAAIVGPPGRW